jgi:hypothetical protein
MERIDSAIAAIRRGSGNNAADSVTDEAAVLPIGADLCGRVAVVTLFDTVPLETVSTGGDDAAV